MSEMYYPTPSGYRFRRFRDAVLCAHGRRLIDSCEACEGLRRRAEFEATKAALVRPDDCADEIRAIRTELTERDRFDKFLVGSFGANADLHVKTALDDLTAAVRAEERERCAKIADQYRREVLPVDPGGIARLIAGQIRSGE
jgi:hypothetical protein